MKFKGGLLKISELNGRVTTREINQINPYASGQISVDRFPNTLSTVNSC